MKKFDVDAFFKALATLKNNPSTKTFLPELKVVLTKAVWEGRAEKELLEKFDNFISY